MTLINVKHSRTTIRRLAALCIFVAIICVEPLQAGTIRHDRYDSLYTGLAELAQYDCAGMVHSGANIGSGTLIASQWVLTAGHMVGADATFTVNGTTYESENYWIHSSEDIAIFQLSEPVVGVLPATLYDPDFGSEIGIDGTMVGFGYTGDGYSGENTYGPLGVKRAGQNTIDATGTALGLSSKTLLIDFDSPDGQNSRLGLSSPLDLEMGPAHGDSGCGLFVEIDNQTYLAGVQSAMWYTDRTDNADYGDGGVFVSIRQTADWIESIVPLNRPPVAIADFYQVGEDQWLNVQPLGSPEDVLTNDSDYNDDSLTAELYEGALHGSVSFNSDGSFSYLCDENYYGPDTFSYRAYDGQEYSQPATVAIDVSPINDAPLAVDDLYEIEYGDAFSAVEGVLANDSDVEDDELTAALCLLPQHGDVTFQDDGTFIYRPDAFFSGEDTFAYLAYDGQMYSRRSTVTITVDEAPLPGDANRDNVVDSIDAEIMAAHWHCSDTGWSGGDFNCDGLVDDIDATILAANWLMSRTAQTAVPEPSNLVLAGGWFFCLAVFLRRRLFGR